MKISVLGIGTELTTGQILNRNGQWISTQLWILGVATAAQLVVPDDRDLILSALEYCSQHSDIVFVTGGLGPTSDDFTREVIAQWTGTKLVWDEASWTHLSDRLSSRGYAVRDIQKQQCYFPEGSLVLKNRLGTANAFSLTYQGKEIFVLPGPPGEIQAVWEDHLAPLFQKKTQSLDALLTRSWDTIGLGESEVADRIEKNLSDCPCEKGYRVHLPYVEFKITHLKSQSEEAKKWIAQIENTLMSSTVLRDGEDAAQKLSQSLRVFAKIVVCDEIPGSFLMQRLFPFCKTLLKERKLNFVTSLPAAAKLEPQTLLLHLKEDSPGMARVSLTVQGQKRSQFLKSPYKAQLLKEREQQYFAEMAMIFWMKETQSRL